MKYLLKVFILLQIFFLSSFSVAGDGSFNTVVRAKTLSLNGLYFAGTDGLQQVLGNPSMLSFLNSSGLEFFAVNKIGTFEIEDSPQGLYQSFNDDNFSFGGGIFWNFSETFNAALSYQRAVDYKINWPFSNLYSNDSVSALLVFDFYNQFTIDAASASFAYKFGNVSVGVSAHFYYVEQHSAFPFSSTRWNQGLGRAAYQVNYDQDGYSYGFGLGISSQINENLRAGLMTKSGFKTDLEGTAASLMFTDLDSISSPANLSGTFEMPWIFGAGIVYNWSEILNVNFDIQYSLWGNIQENYNLIFDNQTIQQNLSSGDSLAGISPSRFTLLFNNTVDAGVGIEYILTDLVLRGSYRYSQSPNSDESFNMLFPAVDQHWVSLGIGYTDGNLIFDGSLAYAFGFSKKVSRQPINLPGNYNSSIILPAVTIKYLL